MQACQVSEKKPQGVTSLVPAQPKTIAPKTIGYAILKVAEGRVPTLAEFNTSLVFLISMFYTGDDLNDIDAETSLVMIAGIVANTLNFPALRPWQPLVNAFLNEGIKIKFIEKDVEWYDNQIPGDARLKAFLALFGEDKFNFFMDSKGSFVFTCIILLLMTKVLNPDNYKGWMKNRVKSFSGHSATQYHWNY